MSVLKLGGIWGGKRDLLTRGGLEKMGTAPQNQPATAAIQILELEV